MKEITTIGIDLAKNVFHVHGVDRSGHTVLEKRLGRGGLEKLMRNLPPCLVGMETCGGAHHWARMFQGFGHEVRLMAGQFVKPFVISNKNDKIDAQAICEAVGRPKMRYVAVKRLEQQDILSWHRIRERRVRQRTALVNEIRGLLQEFGIVFAQGVSRFEIGLKGLLAEEDLRLPLREFLEDLWKEYQVLNERVVQGTRRIEQYAKANERCQRIMKIPGVGALTASAMEASIGNPHVFARGRHVSAWLGLVPRQHSTGGKTRLLGISKRGDRYLRYLLIHGARAALIHAPKKKDRTSRWVVEVAQRRGNNKACVALANKNARRIWAVLATDQPYREAA